MSDLKTDSPQQTTTSSSNAGAPHPPTATDAHAARAAHAPRAKRGATLLCFGELLWDFLPDGLFPGGAPFNVAYHLHQHGLDARILTAVGRDILGEEFLRRIKAWGLPTDTIARHQELPTGYVRAELSASGEARYAFADNVAWDQIPINDEAQHAAMHARGAVFGSLALRSISNRNSLERLLAILPADAWRVFDVNLRAPHDDLELVDRLAPKATLVKLNAAEAARLARDAADETPGREEADARTLAARWGLRRLCITCGARGAGLLHEGQWHYEPGRPVAVADTVGAGDSFLAALLAALLEGETPQRALAQAARLGEWVASQRGATPSYANRR
ncbi:hypothetical protein AXK11_02470 [Cephaloticoccus primus]|uniref:Carbohydrate kinase PfkB domain-containing protein n=1 Tax=Cephaloticoccus primus TaxID=1548207 RepID=A0A139SS13_9BACT|nr:PfkB family carbohydrate kinase [Cephaloticoccus primus]KXU37333.1 hypothetical protein AXK11_02470 [Cephaloticoccus primus]